MTDTTGFGGALGVAVVVGVGLAVLGQLAQPFHLLTHEFTQLFSPLAASVVGLWTWRRASRAPAPDVLVAGVVQGVVMGLAAMAVMLAANALSYDCRVTDGLFFFWVTWLPLAVFAAVVGTVAGEAALGLRRLLPATGALLLAALAHDIIQGLRGVRLSDPLIGAVLFIDQRLDMAVPLVHVYERLWLLAVAAGVWWLRDLWRAPGPVRVVRAGALWGALLLVTVGGGSHVGVGWGTGAIRTQLDAEHHTEHFDIQYRAGGRASLYVDAVARAAEWYHRSLTGAWGVTPGRKVVIRLYDNSRTMHELTGIGNVHAGLYRIDITWNRALGPTLHHELVHALHAELSWRPDLVVVRGMLEGSADAFADGLAAVPEAHRRQAGALRAGKLPSAVDLMSPIGFFSVNEGNAYVASASFMGWLVLEHGIDRFKELQRTLSFTEVYGRDLTQLDADWRAFLSDVPVGLAEQARAREAFDPDAAPAYLDRRCPKLGSRRERLADRAKRLLKQGDLEGALDAHLKLTERKPDKVSFPVKAARILERLGRYDEALALLDGLDADRLDRVESHQVLQVRIDLYRELRAWDELYAAFEARRALRGGDDEDEDPEPEDDDGLGDPNDDDDGSVESLLRDEALREPIAEALHFGSAAEGRTILRDLVEAHPDDDALRHLAASRAFPIPSERGTLVFSPEWRTRIDEALAFVDATPEACDTVWRRLLGLTDTALDQGDLDLAERVAQLMSRRCTQALTRWYVDDRLARISWEKEG